MAIDPHTAHKALIQPLRGAMYDFDEIGVRAALQRAFAPDALIRLAHPFGDMTGPAAFYDRAYQPLFRAIPDLERRDTIVMAGPTLEGADWVGCGGYYTGTFAAPWLDIPPTGHQVHLRFHEFYRFEAGRVTQFQGLWDIPEMMMQADAWPMAPSLGREWHVPGPATQDGLVPGPWNEALGKASCQHILDMLTFAAPSGAGRPGSDGDGPVLASQNELVRALGYRHRARDCRFPKLASDPVPQQHAGSRAARR